MTIAHSPDRRGPRAVGCDADPYPRGLLDLSDAPAILYVWGDWPARSTAVAVVGSRAASPYGVAVAGRLAADLARLGIVVVSGLARGIDAAAHRGALDGGGATVAVVAGSLDSITPRHHAELAARIAIGGAVVSEHASGPPSHRGAFVTRNRLIAALGAATVVVEAAENSGALHTASAARKLGRPVLAVPGDLDRETSRGCHALIKAGARLCEGAADVLDAIEGVSAPSVASRERNVTAPSPDAESSSEARVLRALERVPRPVEAVAAAAGLGIAEALAALLALQWSGLAMPHPGQRWGRREGAGR